MELVQRDCREPLCSCRLQFRLRMLLACVHADFSSGYACFLHVFKDRVVSKNPTRLLPEIPEGELTIEQLNNYTKNPLLVCVFHEMSWVEDLGSGIRNILRYAPLYYPDYLIEINNGSQFIFSITYYWCPLKFFEPYTNLGRVPRLELDLFCYLCFCYKTTIT